MNLEYKNAFKVGIISLILIIAITVLLIWKSGIFIRATGYELIGQFESINGLLKGAEVRYRGFRVGTVSQIDPNPVDIKVHFWVKSAIKIPKGSSLRIVFDGLIGEKLIDIIPNSKSTIILKNKAILKGYATAGLADFVDIGAQNLEHTEAIVESLRDILTSKEVTGSLKNTLLQFEKISKDMTTLINHMHQFTKTSNLSTIVESISLATKSLQSITQRVEQNLLNDDLINNIQDTLENLSKFTQKLEDLLSDQGSSKPQTTIKMFKTINSLRFEPQVGLKHSLTEKNIEYLANLDFNFGNLFFRTGFGDRSNTSQLQHLQQGVHFTKDFSARFGLFYTKPGFGFDYQVLPKIGVTLEMYNLNSIEGNLIGRYSLLDNLNILLELRKESASTNKYNNYLLGVSYHP